MKIPCNCCRPNGMRRRMNTKEFYLCNFCHGTKMREALPGYDPDRKPEVQYKDVEVMSNESLVEKVNELEFKVEELKEFIKEIQEQNDE